VSGRPIVCKRGNSTHRLPEYSQHECLVARTLTQAIKALYIMWNRPSCFITRCDVIMGNNVSHNARYDVNSCWTTAARFSEHGQGTCYCVVLMQKPCLLCCKQKRVASNNISEIRYSCSRVLTISVIFRHHDVPRSFLCVHVLQFPVNKVWIVNWLHAQFVHFIHYSRQASCTKQVWWSDNFAIASNFLLHTKIVYHILQYVYSKHKNDVAFWDVLYN